jgi:probable phosphoglycerate mutase
MTTFFLIRHALCDPVGRRISGRMPGIPLNAAGREQAAQLGQRLAELRFDAIVSSPLDRTRETAGAIALWHGPAVTTDDGLIELDFGEWTGAEIADLADDERWQRFNRFRSGTRAPEGESMGDVQHRVVGVLERLAYTCPVGRVAVVSHLDVLRAALCHYLGMPLDHYDRLDLAPASVTILEISDWSARLVQPEPGG